MSAPTTREFRISNYDVRVWADADACDAVALYIICGAESAREVRARMTGRARLIVCVDCADWNADLSPWPAPRAFAGGDDFTGGADAFYQLLVQNIAPCAEENVIVDARCVCGYSLAGLFALYALTKIDGFFCMAVSASGSLWYDGWTSYIRQNAFLAARSRVYLSLGDREEFTKNARLAGVMRDTRETYRALMDAGAQVYMETNPGGHFAQPDARLTKGVDWILRVGAE